MNIPINQETTFRDLLPIIAKAHKLRIYTDEYVFVLSNTDMKHFKLMSSILDIGMNIFSTGCRIFEMQKKIYSDSSKIVAKPKPNVTASSTNVGTNQFSHSALSSATPNNALLTMISQFTETAANAYQEWNVVKKNKFGRKQERIFGVDGKKVYNAKRGQLRGGNQAGVQRAERDISTIVKIEIIADEHSQQQQTSATTNSTNSTFNVIGISRTFRITWADNNDIYNIEYTCDTSRECIEIVAKVKYVLGRLRNDKRGWMNVLQWFSILVVVM